jgi:hypothetical protein
MAFLLRGQWQVGLLFMWPVISWPVLLCGQWQDGPFCYVVSGKLTSFYVVSNKLACFVTCSVISWPVLLRGH